MNSGGKRITARHGKSNSHNIKAASEKADAGFNGSRKIAFKQQAKRASERPIDDNYASRGPAYSSTASAAKNLSLNPPKSREKCSRSSVIVVDANFPSASADRLTEGIERIRRRCVDSCTYLWKCRIASSAESCMYVLAAKDFGLDVVDSLASGNSPRENHPARRILREIWNC